MKKISAILLLCIMMALINTVSVNAASLDDIINEETSEVYEEITESHNEEVATKPESKPNNEDYIGGSHLDGMKDANDLSEMSEGAAKLNAGIKKVASFIVQVLSYFATACLVLRVLLDIIYIVLPFTRSFLANGYAGNPQSNGTMQQGGMGGMGSMGGMGGMGGYGMGGFGSSRYGMGGMGSMGGMGGMGMNSMQQGMSQPGATPAMGRIQWVSTAALNAVASETTVGPNGKPINPLRPYAKDMVVILVLAPVFLVLAVTGALTDLGLLVGELLANAISNIGGMI